MKILGLDISIGKDKIVNAEEPKKKNRRPISSETEQRQKFRTREDIRKLELAIDQFNNLVNYDREDLHQIYRRNLEDPMLWSQWSTRLLKTKDKEFKVKVNDEENEDATRVFESGWFLDYIDAILNSKLWGFSLIQFGAISDNSFIPYKVKNTYNNNFLMMDAVTEVDRDYVKPELAIVTNMPGDSTGIDFMDPKYSDWLIFEGKAHSTGLFTQMSKYLLFKDNVLGNWSEWAEIFGMDAIIGKTDTQDPVERNKFTKALMDLGSRMISVFDTDDDVEYIGSTRTDAFKVYQELAKYVDEQISKLIFGQDVVSNNTGKVVGNVGENIANLYGDSDAKFVARNVNEKLIPMMINLGFKGLDNAIFEWDNTETLSLIERSKIDLDVSYMGFNPDPDYIEKTYGIELDKTEPKRVAPLGQESGAVNNMRDELKKFYGKDV
jgi:hypothetical protein